MDTEIVDYTGEDFSLGGFSQLNPLLFHSGVLSSSDDSSQEMGAMVTRLTWFIFKRLICSAGKMPTIIKFRPFAGNESHLECNVLIGSQSKRFLLMIMV
jgi:hypothetical protein